MSASLVGAIGEASSTAASITAAYGQAPTSGNLLLALVAAGSQTLESPSISTSATGWSRLISGTIADTTSGTGYVFVDAWVKEATGGDSAPEFAQTLGSTGRTLTCHILEINDANFSDLLDVQGKFQYSVAGTCTFSLSTSGNVSNSGSIAVDIMAQFRGTASSSTWTETGTGWTSGGLLPAGSSALSVQVNYMLNPTTGSAVSDAGHFSTDSTAYGAGLILVINGTTTPVPVDITGVAAAITLAGGVGAVTADATVVVPGVAAEIVLAGGVGSVTALTSVNVTGQAAQIVLAGGVGSVTTSAAVDISGAAAEIILAGGHGAVLSGTSVDISGVAAPIVLAGAVGFITAGSHSRITWDDSERYFSQGISNGVLYPKNSPGVAWNGLISVTEKGDADSSPFYIDGQLYLNRLVPDAFNGTLSAYMYPDEFEPYSGNVRAATGQTRSTFGLSYRSNSEIHIVYNVLAEPSSNQFDSLGDDISPVAFSWDFSTLPVAVPGGRPSAHLVVNTDYADAAAISALEDILYGDDSNLPSLPAPSTVFSMFDSYAILHITDNGDGTWTAETDQDGIIEMLGIEIFQINWSSAVILSSTTYKIGSL